MEPFRDPNLQRLYNSNIEALGQRIQPEARITMEPLFGDPYLQRLFNSSTEVVPYDGQLMRSYGGEQTSSWLMAFEARNGLRRMFGDDFCFQNNPSVDLRSSGIRSSTLETELEQEKRARRQIANNNERRRMQYINSGFETLRKLLPYEEVDKLSKAAILQVTIQYVKNLQQTCEKAKSRIEQLCCMLENPAVEHNNVDMVECRNKIPSSKRKRFDTESSDEKMGLVDSATDGEHIVNLKWENHFLRVQLRNEQARRIKAEHNARELQAQLVHAQRSFLANHLASVPHSVKVEPTMSHTVSDVKEECVMECLSSEPVSKPSTPGNHECLLSKPVSKPSTPANQERLSSQPVSVVIKEEVDELFAKPSPPPAVLAKSSPPPPVLAKPSPPPANQEHLPSDSVVKPTSQENPWERLSSEPESKSTPPSGNLDQLLEAIRQTEGDHVLGDDSPRQTESDSSTDDSLMVQHRENEKEGSGNDLDEPQSSESSGCPSLPSCSSSCTLSGPIAPMAQGNVSDTPPPAHQCRVSNKLPVSAPLHHHPSPYTPKRQRMITDF